MLIVVHYTLETERHISLKKTGFMYMKINQALPFKDKVNHCSTIFSKHFHAKS